MEFRELCQHFWAARRTLFFFSLLSAFAAFSLALRLWPTTYRASLDLYVKRQVQSPSEKFYTFDGFYSQQAAERYTQTVIGFLKSGETLRQAAVRVNRPTDQDSLRSLARAVRVKEAAPQLIHLAVSFPQPHLAADFSSALAQVTIGTLEKLNRSGDEALRIDLLADTPLLEVYPPQPFLAGLLGLAGGLLFGLWGVALRVYWRSGEGRS